jgi:DNA-binding beta-propeller fold protein YncE
MKPIRSSLMPAVAFVAAGMLLRCGASDDESGAGQNGYGGGGTADSGAGAFPGSGGAAGASGDAAPPPPPPEKELESSYRSPVATGRYVWTANPESGRVALVDAFTLEIRLAEAGFGPTHLAAISGPGEQNENIAIVLNVLSHDATLLRVKSPSQIQQKTLKTHQGANAWAVSPGGKWAIAWSNAAVLDDPEPTDGFQDVTVISLAEGAETATRLTVGYRPTRIAFDAAETRAFAVTEPGISVLSLEEPGPAMIDLIEVTDNPLENPASRDVVITPDGTLALVRRDGSADVGLVDLTTSQRTSLTLSGQVTDLDLSEDGSLAVAIVRERSEVVLLPIPELAGDPSATESVTIAGELFGSVVLSADASRALLFTNAVPNDHLTILELAPGPNHFAHRTVSVKTPVQAVFPAPSALHAIALQSPGAGSSKAGAFSVVPLGAQVSPKIMGTDAPPTAVAIAPAPGDRALVAVRDDTKKIYGVYVARLSNLQVDFVKLASPPLATGIVPAAGMGYVAQEHPEGRLTFVGLDDGSVRTLTGFELGAKVVD